MSKSIRQHWTTRFSVRLLALAMTAGLILAGCGQATAPAGGSPTGGQQGQPAAPAQTIDLKYAFFAPPSTFPAKQMEQWASEITKRTNGQVKVQTFPGGTLLNAQDMYDGVLSGVADIGLGSPAYDPGRFKLLSGFGLPLGFPSATVASLVLWDIVHEFQPDELKDFKIVTLFTTEPGFIQSTAPVRNLNDLKGMELRAAGTGVPVLQALGAAPVGMAMPEVPEAVQKGVVKGTMTSREVLQDFKLAEQLKYVADYPTVVVTFAAVMDKKKFDALPDNVKQVIDELGREMAIWTGQYHDNENIGAALEWAQKEHGLQILSLDAGEKEKWDQALAPMVDKWVQDMTAAGLPAEQFVKRVGELNDKYAAEYK